MTTVRTFRIAPRQDTASNFTTNNPTLADKELAIETDTGLMKLGDGTTAWTSLAYLPPARRLLDKANESLKIVDNTVTETSLYSFAVPANTMGLGGVIHAHVALLMRNDTGAVRAPIYRIKFGGTTLYHDAATFNDAGTEMIPLTWDIWISNNGSASAQRTTGLFIAASPTVSSPPTVGHGRLDTDWHVVPVQGIDGTKDTTSAQTLDLTVELDAADVTHYVDRTFAFTELLRAA